MSDDTVPPVPEPTFHVVMPTGTHPGALAWLDQYPGVRATTNNYLPPGKAVVIRTEALRLKWEPSWDSDAP